MSQLTERQCREILEKVMSFSRADECESNINSGATGNIRFARNTVSTSGIIKNTSLVVQSSFGKKTGTATINEFDDASLQKVVRRSEELAKLAPENPEYMSFLPQQDYVKTKSWFKSTADITPEFRASAAAASLKPARAKGIEAAGFLQDNAGSQAMINTKGLFAYHQNSNINFSVTMRTKDGTGSGWASRDFNDASLMNTGEASGIAIDKAVLSQKPRAIEPGKYTVILEPAASSGLLRNLLFSLGARQADEGRSFLSKKGGGTKLGEKIVDERVSMYSDPTHPEISTSPWANDGQSQKKMYWIKNGVVENMFYSRYWAQKNGVAPVPFPANGIMDGGTASIEDLIKSTKRGVLVTRTWYIRTVDPQTLLYTGLTRDGTFFVENGKIKFPVKNFRFNESPIIMLNNVEAFGKPLRHNGNLIPPMKIRDFTFSSLSDAV